MATNTTNSMIQHLRRDVLLADRSGLTDGQLLGSFIERRDEAAFAAIVHRHGPMVWGVCRRRLHPQDAEDAFQATFLVLARKAAAVVPREMVGNWLYGVAHRTVLQARRTAVRRKGREMQVADMPEPAVTEQDCWSDLQPLLDEELARLPDKYRALIVLCDLEGKTRKEVAGQFGLPEGTVAGRLARARTMLAKRLAGRGVMLSGGALAAVISQNVAAGVPPSVTTSTVRAATGVAAGQAATGAVSVEVAALTEGVLKTMLLGKLKLASVALLVVMAGLTLGVWIYQTQASAQPPGNGRPSNPAVGEKDARAGQDARPTRAVEKAPDRLDKEMSGREVVATFEQNEARGDELFLGKKLRVTGKVFKVERVALRNKAFMSNLKESDDQYYLLTLRAEPEAGEKSNRPGPGEDPFASSGRKVMPLAFIFPVGSRKQLGELQEGQPATIEGVCQGRKGDVLYYVIFTGCEIVKTK